jgi:hypothetical protein
LHAAEGACIDDAIMISLKFRTDVWIGLIIIMRKTRRGQQTFPIHHNYYSFLGGPGPMRHGSVVGFPLAFRESLGV